MALGTPYLVDTSALSRVAVPAVGNRLHSLARLGMLATCSIVDLELGFSARSAAHHSEIIAARRKLPQARVDQATLDRALELQAMLARTGHHRVPLQDLIIAACAIDNGMVVMHYDTDFDTIAAVSELRSDWVVPRGSV